MVQTHFSKPRGQFLKSSVLIILAGLLVVGCTGKQKPKTRLVFEERPVELLYNTGMEQLDKKSYTDAAQYFEEVQRQHPYTEWSRRAIIMTIYANYMSDRYTEASEASDQFIRLYPGSPLTPYAYYMKAICAFEQIVDVGRDQAYTVSAQGMLRDIIRRYPQTPYAQDARVKLDMVADQLAGKEMEIGRYYLKENQPLAAIGRFKSVTKEFQTTSHAPEALYRLVESYEMLGLKAEATRNAAVLGYNYPGDRWYAKAYGLLTETGATPNIAPDPQGKKGIEALEPVDAKAKKKKSLLSRINPF